MTAILSTGASPATSKEIWSQIKWPKIKGSVIRLQMRIAKAEDTAGLRIIQPY